MSSEPEGYVQTYPQLCDVSALFNLASGNQTNDDELEALSPSNGTEHSAFSDLSEQRLEYICLSFL